MSMSQKRKVKELEARVEALEEAADQNSSASATPPAENTNPEAT